MQFIQKFYAIHVKRINESSYIWLGSELVQTSERELEIVLAVTNKTRIRRVSEHNNRQILQSRGTSH